MTERSWQTATRPYPMIDHLGPNASPRKLRLVGVEACNRLWGIMTDPRSRNAVSVAERFANGEATEDELLAANTTANNVGISVVERTAARASDRPQEFNLDVVLGHAGSAAQNRAERKIHCNIIRDIFGNPFRPVAFGPEWRTDTAVAIAGQMYESRDFSAMPILADALQDAGCDSDDILSHCRDAAQVHVRGCWVVDRVLGKE